VAWITAKRAVAVTAWPGPALDILLVDDDPADVLIIREALESTAGHAVHVVDDGLQALAYLRREGPFGSAARPDLVLLDLNLPFKSGQEVLAEVKADPDLRVIPIVIVSSSDAPQDIMTSYATYANGYLVKPGTFDAFARLIRQAGDFYLATARVPHQPMDQPAPPPTSGFTGSDASPF
jgi:CheY-like chemotaxis protein